MKSIENFRQIEGYNKKMAHTSEFKSYVSVNPGVVAKIKDLIDKTANAERVEDGELSVEQIGNMMHRFEVCVGQEKFFVKRLDYPNYGNRADGFIEIKTSHEVEEKIKDLAWVKVVEYLFGYTHGVSSFFVSKWDDKLKTEYSVANYLKQLQEEKNSGNIAAQNKIDDISKKVQILKERLANLKDFKEHNMAYDKENDMIILFDLSE